jgi:hypothetical protein
MPLPEGMIPFDRLKYEQAILAAPGGTLIKFGDLEREMVKCTTCGAEMLPEHTQFHKHPKKCDTCGDHFDENLEKHTPDHVTEQRGGGTIGYSRGCKKETL